MCTLLIATSVSLHTWDYSNHVAISILIVIALDVMVGCKQEVWDAKQIEALYAMCSSLATVLIL